MDNLFQVRDKIKNSLKVLEKENRRVDERPNK